MFVFFFKQKTAYDVLISDWSSDVCSSDLFGAGIRWNAPDLKLSEESYAGAKNVFESRGRRIIDCTVGGELRIFPRSTLESERSEERRVGNECVRTSRSRWSPDHLKENR